MEEGKVEGMINFLLFGIEGKVKDYFSLLT